MDSLLDKTIAGIRPLDEAAMAAARTREDSLTKPRGSLGRLEEIAIQIAGIQGKDLPQINHKAVITMAGDHGVVEEGVSAWPQDVTAEMVANFLAGGAAINVMARRAGARVIVVDMGVAAAIPEHPGLLSRKIAAGTRNMARGPAMTSAQAVSSVEAGIEVVASEIEKGLDIVGTGDMGIGNTTSSSAICAVISGRPPAEVTGRGAGLNDAQLKHKIQVIQQALALNKPDPARPLDVLMKVGGFEIGGLAGVMLGAAAHRIPVVIDGFISGASALLAASLAPGVRDYLIPAHLSVELGHRVVMQQLGLKPLLDLDLRLGEGTGAAIGIFLAETAVHVLAEMATFGEAGVSDNEK